MWPGNLRPRSLLPMLAAAVALFLGGNAAHGQSGADAWTVLEKEAHWIPAGAEEPERVIYVFTDPNCPYCHDLWKVTKPYYSEGLQVRHILVGILKPSSPAKAAAILSANDPAAALRRHEKNYEDGGIAPAEDPAQLVRTQLENNQQLMRRFGARATPTVVYRDGDGGAQALSGMPRLQALPGILRLPAQPIEDPDLQKYL
ncbi:thiol:disulfide interchange protein DsbG [Thiohalorhabdus methylotrophus]|uniref:Thiol:disulfide interchange protein n=1 Tax=Thiohalorhabdus methylotrophus TaxID=3242694 RepID=A0ABV4TTL4_9GAMM